MRFQPDLPLCLAQHLRELTDLEVAVPCRELPHRPTDRRVMRTLLRLAESLRRRYEGFRVEDSLSEVRSELDVAQALLKLALAAPIPGCTAAFGSPTASHLHSCPACSRHLQALYETAMTDLQSGSLSPQKVVSSEYAARFSGADGADAEEVISVTLLAVKCDVQCIMVLAETPFQLGYLEHQASEHLYLVPELVRELGDDLLSARYESRGRLDDEHYKELVDLFVAKIMMQGLRPSAVAGQS